MKIKTSRFGEIEVGDDQVVMFPEGILGFSDIKTYATVEQPATHPLRWLQSAEFPTLAFLIVDPRLFFPDYVVRVRSEDLMAIKLDQVEEGDVWVIVTVPPNPMEMTANLLGPLVINLRDRLGKQLVLIDSRYKTKHRLFPESTESSEVSGPP